MRDDAGRGAQVALTARDVASAARLQLDAMRLSGRAKHANGAFPHAETGAFAFDDGSVSRCERNPRSRIAQVRDRDRRSAHRRATRRR